MKLANEDVSMLAFTSEQIVAPFLLPEMVPSFSFSFLIFSLLAPAFFSLGDREMKVTIIFRLTFFFFWRGRGGGIFSRLLITSLSPD